MIDRDAVSLTCNAQSDHDRGDSDQHEDDHEDEDRLPDARSKTEISILCP